MGRSKYDRRWFLKCTGILTAGASPAVLLAQDVPDKPAAAQTRRMQFPEAFRLGRRIGIGTTVLEGPASAEVASLGTWTLVFTAGRAGVSPGGGVRIGLRHMNHLWTAIQNTDPKAEGFLSVQGPAHAPARVQVACSNWGKFFNPYFPYQNIVEAIVGGSGLRPGDSIRVTFGDRSGGGPGMKLQPFSERQFRFMTYVDVWGNGGFLPVEESPTLAVSSGPAAKLTAIVPSDAVCGRPSWCAIRAEDRFGNAAESYRGTVRLSGDAGLSAEHTFTENDRGVYRFEGILLDKPGVTRLAVEDGQISARSNPMVVHAGPPARRVLWGDLHGHSNYSDGRGTPESYYDHARRVAVLDFAALTDHDFELSDEAWAAVKGGTRAANEPGRFTTIVGYEWSGMPGVGGDHNVYWLDDDPPIYRSVWEDSQNFQWVQHSYEKAADVESLFALLRRHKRGENVLVIPHRGGRPANPQWHDPQLQRLVEASSEHFRSLAWAETFLQRGLRLGLMASSDNHYGHPGYGYLMRGQFSKGLYGEGLVAVLAEENNRPSIFSALCARHCYATTGDRIVLDFRVNGALMGSEIRALTPPEINVYAAGATTITRIEIVKDGQPLHAVEPNRTVAELTWQAPPGVRGKISYYYVRIVQDNGEEAWSSPVWVES